MRGKPHPRIPKEIQRYRVRNQAEARMSLNFFREMNSINSATKSQEVLLASENDSMESVRKFRRVSDG